MQKSKTRHIIKNYLTGKLRCAEFAITNSCIAKCSFCDIWKQNPKVFVDGEKALRAIDRLAELGVSHLTLTGGEPLLHPDAYRFTERAARHNMNIAMLVAAPQLLVRDDAAKRLEDAGCDIVSISFDSGDPETMAMSRRIPGIMDHMKVAMQEVKKTSLKSMASVLIWNDNYDKLESVCERACSMGFDVISLNYPTFSDSVVYALGGDGVSLSREKVISALEGAIALKRDKSFPIINSVTSMKNIIAYLRDPKAAKFPCFGGRRVMFVDWFFDVRPCMQLPGVLGNILTMDDAALEIPPCNQCNMSWYRDFSTYFHGLRSLPVLVESITSAARLL